MKNDSEHIFLSRKGLFLGPNESLEQFAKRVHLMQHLEKTLPQYALDAVSSITTSLFDFAFDTMPCCFGNKGLGVWEGAALWITEEDGARMPQIQLSTKFKMGSYYTYSQEEVLAHEMVHAARIAFDEPKYEEILAYKTAKSSFRKWAGPLFGSSYESIVFVILLALGLTLQSVSFFFSIPFLSFAVALSFVWLGWLMIRLYRRQSVFKKAQEHIAACVKDPTKTLAVMVRMKDREIEECAKRAKKDVLEYFRMNAKSDARLKMIYLSYLSR